MRHINAVLFGLLASVVVAAGCNSADPATNTDPTIAETSAKNVRMSLTAHGKADASVKLHVFSKLTAKEVFTQSLQIEGGTTAFLQLGLDSDDYTFKADVFADVEQTISLGSSSTDCSVESGHMSEISLVINTEVKGSVGIDFSSNDAPLIDDVSVKLNTSLDIAALIHVNASDTDGKNLHYFWTGFCIDGTIEGSASLEISVDVALAALAKGGDHTITVIVQDELGATAHVSIDVELDLDVDVGVGVDTNTGNGNDNDNDTCTDASVEIELGLCLDIHASCAASCKVAAATSLNGAALLVSCLAKCGLTLATCNAACGCDGE
ncbi:MAG: hypothetical protein ABI134_20500 [Byssovorax sp.]